VETVAPANQRSQAYSGLIERLIGHKLISTSDAAEVAERARSQGTTVVRELLEEHQIEGAVLARLVSEEYGVSLLELGSIVLDHLPVDLVPQSLIRKHKCLPLYRRGNRLFLAVADPTNKSAIDEFKFATGIATDTVVVEAQPLAQLIDEVIARQDEIFDGDKVADQYEMQVDNAVDSISSLIEPLIMSVLGILIGGLMIAIYLPLFMLGSVM